MPRPTACRAWSSTVSATRSSSRSTRPAWQRSSRSSRRWTRSSAAHGSSPATIRRPASSKGWKRGQGAQGRAAGPAGAGRERPDLHCRPGRRAEDRLVLRPARQPPLRGRLARGEAVLDVYSYCGGFALTAAARGATASDRGRQLGAGPGAGGRQCAAPGPLGRVSFERAEAFAFLDAAAQEKAASAW